MNLPFGVSLVVVGTPAQKLSRLQLGEILRTERELEETYA